MKIKLINNNNFYNCHNYGLANKTVTDWRHNLSDLPMAIGVSQYSS
jgi:hypothetical protein